MAYDEQLAEEVRERLAALDGEVTPGVIGALAFVATLPPK